MKHLAFCLILICLAILTFACGQTQTGSNAANNTNSNTAPSKITQNINGTIISYETAASNSNSNSGANANVSSVKVSNSNSTNKEV